MYRQRCKSPHRRPGHDRQTAWHDDVADRRGVRRHGHRRGRAGRVSTRSPGRSTTNASCRPWPSCKARARVAPAAAAAEERNRRRTAGLRPAPCRAGTEDPRSGTARDDGARESSSNSKRNSKRLSRKRNACNRCAMTCRRSSTRCQKRHQPQDAKRRGDASVAQAQAGQGTDHSRDWTKAKPTLWSSCCQACPTASEPRSSPSSRRLPRWNRSAKS